MTKTSKFIFCYFNYSFHVLALILYKKINQRMSASDYERKRLLKYEIFIENVISCANKQREVCF